MRSVLRRTILILGLGAIAALVALASAGPARTSALNAACPATLVHHEPNPRLGTLSGGLWIEAVVPPSAGCWRLTLTRGKLRNSLVARVDD